MGVLSVACLSLDFVIPVKDETGVDAKGVLSWIAVVWKWIVSTEQVLDVCIYHGLQPLAPLAVARTSYIK